MYVRIYLQVMLPRPTHIVDAFHPRPPRRFSEPTAGGGTAITHGCPPGGSPPSGGHVCISIYTYSLCRRRCVPSLLRHADLQGLRCLSERESIPVIPWGSLALLLLLATCRAAAAGRRRLRRQVPFSLLLLPLVCSESASRNLYPTPPLPGAPL
jgi:hypothetical protein